MTVGTEPELILATIQKAIDIQKEIDERVGQASVHQGRYLYFQGTVYLGMDRKRDTLNCFSKSRDIL